jgi:hypothetical protein
MPDPQAIVDEFQAEITEMLRLAAPTRSTLSSVKPTLANGHCHATTKAGQPCRNRAVSNSQYCAVHVKQMQ